MNTNIIVTLQIEGIHRWPKALELFPEVKYLSDPHRHIFHIVAKKKVNHDDRDIEIIMFKKELQDYFKRNFWCDQLKMVDFRSKSCEMIAKDLMEAYNLDYCSVLEDNENGAEVWSE